MWPIYCKFYDQGYCSRKNDCAFLHAFEICESFSREDCSKMGCLKRHPKMCKFDFNCNKRAVCAFRHSNTSILYVPGEDKELKERNDNFLLLKYFMEAQGGSRAMKLSFFAKDGKVSANIEIQPCPNDKDTHPKNIERESTTETTQFTGSDTPCPCASPTPLYSNPSICFWCKGTVELGIANGT